MLNSRVLSTVAVVALCLATAGCSNDEASPSCAVAAPGDIAPATGALFGVNLDWGKQTLAQYAQAIGKRPAVAVSFASFPLSAADSSNITSAAQQVRQNGGALLLTLEPQGGLATVTQESAVELGQLLAGIENGGTAVIVRFGHEMNGAWYAWGQQPAAYIAAFRTVSAVLDDYAPNTEMMWAPNYGGGYPFTGGQFAAQPNSADFAALDTDADGALTSTDDPYAPYYPGDDVVDWVGMSLYHWGSTFPWGENEMPEPGKFDQQLTGEYNGLGGDDTAVPDFYAQYGAAKGKPVAVPETAALVVPRGDAAQERAIKRAWWQQVFAADTATRFPQLRMINWFEWDKVEPEVGDTVDWSITTDQVTTDAFVGDLPSWLHFSSAPGSCDPTS